MSSPDNKRFQAVILDMDGVLTKTAAQHARAWKAMFDRYNERRREAGQPPYAPFSIEEDYPEYIDGLPRYDGVRRFLASRDIDLPEGDPGDEPGAPTVCGLGNWKNQLFQAIIEKEGVETFSDNIRQVRRWRAAGLKTAVISASKNCRRVLRSAGIEDLFEVRVDGVVAEERDLAGKPAPDVFLEAARELAVEPARTIVVEDARAGVKAGREGGFGLVVGLRNNATAEALRQSGADVVVDRLTNLTIE